MRVESRDIPKIKDWLVLQGCEILPNTSEYEALRFKGKEVGVIYKTGKTSGRYTDNAIRCMRRVLTWKGAPDTTKRLGSYAKHKKALLSRDGGFCFYCGQPLGGDISLEHLIPLTQGGLNILSNMVLCHEQENKQMGAKGIKEKVAFAIFLRGII